jgi:hypothetical protein
VRGLRKKGKQEGMNQKLKEAIESCRALTGVPCMLRLARHECPKCETKRVQKNEKKKIKKERKK